MSRKTQLIFDLGLSGFVLCAAMPLIAQRTQAPAVGVPTDWTHHRLIFADPGTQVDAARQGKLAHWNKIVSDRRYQLQQVKQNLLERQLAAAPDYAAKLAILSSWDGQLENRKAGKRTEKVTPLKTDWSMNIGNKARVGAGQYPAKFTFNTDTASCSDYVAYNTGVAGVSGGQANIVGYSNLYETTCTAPVPTVDFAYYSGSGSALTSIVLSPDGTKLAYVENSASGAVLRILQWHAGQGTPAAAATPDRTYTNTTATSSTNTSWNTTNCPATGSCLISVAFQDGAQDTLSAPFYRYDGTDTLYVGDAKGNLHKFTGVFAGSPAEVVASPWPIAVSANVLTSPVYDSGTSDNIFVADSGGYLYSYNASTGAHQMTSSKLTYASGTVGIADAPIVDSSTEEVYVFIGQDANTAISGNYNCNNATGCSGVFQFAASNSTIGTGACVATSATAWSGTNCGVEALFGVGTTTTPTEYDGAFDHIYNVGTGKTGNLWVCAPHVGSTPRLASIAIQTNGSLVPSGTVASFSNVTTAVSALASATASCSPVTEVWGSGGGTNDYIFLSVTANGNLTTTNASAPCTGSCLYNFIVGTGGTSTTAGTLSTPTTAYAGISATSGTSGIVIDNTTGASGESQIYYTPLANQICGGNGSTGSGTGGCAVQTSQTLP